MNGGKYSSLSDADLHALYRQESWENLSEKSRLSLLQETVDREIAAAGGQFSCTVVFSPLSNDTAGVQHNNIIELNRDMFVNDREVFTFTDSNGKHTIEMHLDSANYLAHESVIHELIHAFQDNAKDGKLMVDERSLAVIKANDTTVTTVEGQRASQYMNSGSYMMYYLNPTEMQARQLSEGKTQALINELMPAHGSEKAMEKYAEHIAMEGYAAKTAEYSHEFNVSDIRTEVENALLNASSGSDLPVDKNIEKAVHTAMIRTQQQIDSMMAKPSANEKQEDTPLSINEHVSREQYSDTLKSTVNGYYEHLIESGHSQQQAMEQTMPVAESYHNAMEEFDAAQAVEHQESDLIADIQTSQSDLEAEASQSVETGTVETDIDEAADNTADEDIDESIDTDGVDDNIDI